MINDIVQFRLIEIDSKKIPIFLDEATPYQREEYNGKTVDPLVTATGKLCTFCAFLHVLRESVFKAHIAVTPKTTGVLTESKNNVKKLKSIAAPPTQKKTPAPKKHVTPKPEKRRVPENVRDLAKFSFGSVSTKNQPKRVIWSCLYGAIGDILQISYLVN